MIAQVVYLQTGNIKSYVVTDDVVQETEQKFEAILSQIHQEIDFRPEPSGLCDYCEFQEACSVGGIVKRRKKPKNKRRGYAA